MPRTPSIMQDAPAANSPQEEVLELRMENAVLRARLAQASAQIEAQAAEKDHDAAYHALTALRAAAVVEKPPRSRTPKAPDAPAPDPVQ